MPTPDPSAEPHDRARWARLRSPSALVRWVVVFIALDVAVIVGLSVLSVVGVAPVLPHLLDRPEPTAADYRPPPDVVGRSGLVVEAPWLAEQAAREAARREARQRRQAAVPAPVTALPAVRLPLASAVESLLPVLYPLGPGTDYGTTPYPAPTTGSTSFRVASFNVLGSSHTGKGGRHSKFTDGATRMRWTVQILQDLGISVAGFQEFQPPQHAVFHAQAPGWSVWPTAAHGRKTMVNAVVWRDDVWEPVRTETIAIPYFGGRPRDMPYVLLENRQSGQQVWFTSFHNPADAHGPAQQWRDEATRREIDLARRLMADGTPVVFTGDMNDREEYFCPLTTSTTMHAANGGSTGVPCQPPPRMNVDWLFGSPDVSFSGFVATDSGLVGRTSDHPLVYADAATG